MITDFEKGEAQRKLSHKRFLPAIGSVYRHYKGGLYVIMAVGIDEATGVPMVAYRSNTRDTVWFRTLDNFQELTDGPNGKITRFWREDA